MMIPSKLPSCMSAMACLLAVTSSVHAQTRFIPTSAKADVTRYTAVEECLAATQRVGDSLFNISTVYQDTTPLVARELTDALPAPVVETARRCAARFQTTTAPLKDFSLLVPLFLTANRNVDSLIQRRLASYSPEADVQRAAILDTAASAFVSAFPVQFAIIDSLLTELARYGARTPPMNRIKRNHLFLERAVLAQQTVFAHRAAERILATAAQMTDVEKQSAEFSGDGRRMLYDAVATLQRATLLDSLRRGTAMYASLHRALWEQATGEDSDAIPIPVGEVAPPLTGDHWFPAAPATPSPTRGKPALVVFLGQECRTEAGDVPPPTKRGDSCLGNYAALRRLAQRFPALGITVVAQTYGYFSKLEPQTPKSEAEQLRKWWLEYHRLPVTLTVTNTQYFRIPAPDGRRINQITDNTQRYAFGQSATQVVQTRLAYLIDSDGLVIHAERLDRTTEPKFSELIDILLRRTATGS